LREEKNMLKKSFGFFVFMMMFAAAVFPVAGTIKFDEKICVITDLMKDTNIIVNLTSSYSNYKNEDVYYELKGEYIDQQQPQHGPYGYDINYDQFVAQSFKPSIQRLSKVELKLFLHDGIPDYDLEFSIREELNGDNLVYITKEGSEVVHGWNEFDFLDLQVEIEKTYYLVCEGDGGIEGDPFYGWMCVVEGSAYDRGMAYIYSYGAWHDVTASDCCFRTYYTNFKPELSNISGPMSGRPRIEYNYTFDAFDPDGDDIKYFIDWGDTTSEWTDFNASGTNLTLKHTWSKKGTYNLTAKAKDVCGFEGPVGTLTVTIPKNKASSSNYILMDWFFERFPLLEVFLRAMNLLR
jgi:hypothetical protein